MCPPKINLTTAPPPSIIRVTNVRQRCVIGDFYMRGLATHLKLKVKIPESVPQKAQDVELMLVKRSTTVSDAGPTLNQHCCLLGK